MMSHDTCFGSVVLYILSTRENQQVVCGAQAHKKYPIPLTWHVHMYFSVTTYNGWRQLHLCLSTGNFPMCKYRRVYTDVGSLKKENFEQRMALHNSSSVYCTFSLQNRMLQDGVSMRSLRRRPISKNFCYKSSRGEKSVTDLTND